MSDDAGLVVVRAFSQVVEAQLAISALRAAGLNAHLEDENVVAANWMYSNAVGGVKVLVPHGELSAARAILDIPAVVEERLESLPPGTAENSDNWGVPTVWQSIRHPRVRPARGRIDLVGDRHSAHSCPSADALQRMRPRVQASMMNGRDDH